MNEFEADMADAALFRAGHEFGHYIVGLVHGFKPAGISISNGLLSLEGGSVEPGLHQPLGNMRDLEDFCKRRVLVLLAGAAAEALENGAVATDRALNYLDSSAKSDADKTTTLVRLLSNIESARSPGDHYQEIGNRLWSETETSVVSESEIISALASELVQSTSIKGLHQTGITTKDLQRDSRLAHLFRNWPALDEV